MSYYWFDRQELLEKAKEKYQNGGGKEKLLGIILLIKMFQKKKQKIGIETCEKKKEAIRDYSRKRYRNMKMQANRVSKK